MEEMRTYPHDLDAEKSVLGAILLHESALLDVDGLEPRHFYRQAHAVIFKAIRALSMRGIVPDGLTVKDALARSGTLESTGGFAYLASLVDGVPRSSNVTHYAEIVREKADRRSLIIAGQLLADEAFSGDEDVKTLINRASQSLFAVERQGSGSDPVSMASLMPKVMDQIERWQANKGGVTGLATGYRDLDDMLCGLQPQELVVLAARPSMGKSALAMNIAEHVAVHLDKSVLVFSLEMSALSLGVRELSGEAEVDSYRIKRGRLGGGDYARISHAYGVLGNERMWVDESPYKTVQDIRSTSRRMKLERGLDLVVIDYLQLIASEGKRHENRVLEIATMTRALKGLAKELGIPVILLSQLNRQSENRPDNKPRLSDLRDSGAVEQDADVVLLLYREAQYPDRRTEANAFDAEIGVAKQRNGPTGTVYLRFDPRITKFYNKTS